MSDMTPLPPIKKIQMGVRAIPVKEPDKKQPKYAAETCGDGHKSGRLPRLDELDGDAFK